MTETNNILNIVFNDEIVLQFDRNKPIPLNQSIYLDNMDERMDSGIQQKNELVVPTEALQKSQFVANSMVNSLIKQDFNQAIAMCTYLGNRMPNLKQVICSGQEDENGIKIEFVYDHELISKPQEQTIQFFNPKDFMKK